MFVKATTAKTKSGKLKSGYGKTKTGSFYKSYCKCPMGMEGSCKKKKKKK